MTEHLLTASTPATDWLEAYPIGNGRTGALVHGRPGSELIRLNDGTAWSGGPGSARLADVDGPAAIAEARAALDVGDTPAATAAVQRIQARYSQAFLPFADLLVTSAPSAGEASGDPEGYARSLDLRAAEAGHSYRIGGGQVAWGAFASHPDGVVVLTVTSERPLDIGLAVTSQLRVIGARTGERDALTTLQLPSDVPPPHEAGCEIAYSDAPGDSLRGAVAIAWSHDGTDADAAPGALAATGVRRARIVVATETGFLGFGATPETGAEGAEERASARAAAAVARESDELRERHVADHSALYARSELRLGAEARDGDAAPAAAGGSWERLLAAGEHPLAVDPGLGALLYHYGRYLLIASSRDGVPATLQGLWNTEMRPPWSSNYTVNINTEMNYWLAETTDLTECLPPLFNLIGQLARTGEATATDMYGARGWVAHHNADPWGYGLPVGLGESMPSWAFWPMAQAWLVHHMVEHVRFGGGDAFAAETAWPILRSAALFSLDWLVELPDGTLGTSPSTAPENVFIDAEGRLSGIGISSSMDLSLIRSQLLDVIELADRLGIEDPIVDDAIAALGRIEEPLPGRDGLMREWAADDPQGEPGHRHLSHLWGLHPGHAGWDEERRTAAARSLDDRGDDSTGWSLVWKIALRARLGDGERVGELTRYLFRPATAGDGQRGGLYPNFFAAHPPFQIDGNLGFVAAVAEALVQSHTDTIELLPAVPGVWPSGSVSGLIARPGVRVGVEWERGEDGSARLVSATIAAARPDGHVGVRVASAGRFLDIDLSDGAERRLTAADFAGPDAGDVAAQEAE